MIKDEAGVSVETGAGNPEAGAIQSANPTIKLEQTMTPGNGTEGRTGRIALMLGRS